ncbi:hypothetical protein BJ912DRAFT_1057583 [Pholiota molesta]|nr:hypothetical protein BJ912DRAFT_1057583 [Pholiota molesta]
MSSPHLDLDKTLGAVFIGNIAAAALFGLTSLQAFIFFSGNTRDRRLFKRLIAFLWILDLFHIMFMTHGVYRYLITDFPFLRTAKAYMESFVSDHNNKLLFVITAGSIFVSAMGIVYAGRGFIDGSYEKLDDESWILYTALGGSVVVDGLITASLCILLKNIRTVRHMAAPIHLHRLLLRPQQTIHQQPPRRPEHPRRAAQAQRRDGSIPQSPSSIEPLTMHFLATARIHRSIRCRGGTAFGAGEPVRRQAAAVEASVAESVLGLVGRL